ncbi:DUF3427 domain-containing protein [Peptostreptococcaceae bacterium AGR-M142]
MELKKGFYEQIINKKINEEIKNNSNEIDVYKDKVNTNDSSAVLSTYLSYVFKKGLNYFKSKEEDLVTQVNIANKLIDEFSKLVDDEEFKNYKIENNNMLKAVFEKTPIKKDLKDIEKLKPITSIAKSSLFTGANSEPTVFSELNKEIKTSDRVDLLVSFIKYSGIRLLMDSLKEHTKTKELRIITTSYMGASDFKAIKMLSELPNTKIKISYDTKRTRLHAKAYYFHRETGFSTAYIGSSNISKSALVEGTEWNLKISEYTSKDVMEKYKITFETYWNSSEFEFFDINNLNHSKKLKESLGQESIRNTINSAFYFDIRPYAYQQTILDRLEVERDIYNSHKNLIVAATGTGKTVISAFDFKRYYKENKDAKCLFLAHRKEILEQSIETFRGILKDQNFGDLWVANYKPTQSNHIFASIQTLNNNQKYLEFDKGHFDYIVLDETHHGCAISYDNLINHFEPKILLGLTATPERMDGKDILSYFNDRIAYEIRLHEAIDRNLLCPFHYFGLTDSVDLSNVKWSRGGYDINELNNVLTGNDKRASLILKEIDKYINDIQNVKGIGFCVSKEHAKYMSNYFNKRNIPSINLDSNSDNEIRESAKQKLIKGEIKFIFVVDLYNEGVDIKEINTVLFLRPTESSTVFIQQLGRGLRLSEDKDVLTVFDFVGQANKRFDYRTKLRRLIGKTNNNLKEEIENEFPTLPKGCYIHLERKAKEYILTNIKNTYANKTNLRKMIRNFSHETNKELNLKNFLDHYNLKLEQIYKTTSFYELCYLESQNRDYKLDDEKKLKSALKKVIHIDSIKFINFLLEFLKKDSYSLDDLNNEEKLMLIMFHYTIWNTSPNGDLLFYLNRLKNNNEILLKEIIEILKYNRANIDFVQKDVALLYDCPLQLYSKYNKDQILSAFGVHTVDRKKPFREGVYHVKEKDTDLFFITINKSSKHFSDSTSYDDYAISQKIFHWQSQSRTSDISETGKRYINQRKNNNKVCIFVRENKSEYGITSPFYFLGKANYVAHKGSKPISITWELEEKIPVFLFKKSNKIVDVI